MGFILTTEVCQEFYEQMRSERNKRKKGLVNTSAGTILQKVPYSSTSGNVQACTSETKEPAPMDVVSSGGEASGSNRGDDDKRKSRALNVATTSTLASTAAAAAAINNKEESESLNQRIVDEYMRSIHEIEKQTGRIFGGKPPAPSSPSQLPQTASEPFPLLFSIRATCPITCAGLADTILNIGMNDDVLDSLLRLTSNPRFAYDTYLRFLQQYGHNVMNMPLTLYEDILDAKRVSCGLAKSADFSSTQMKELILRFKAVAQPPVCPLEQLKQAIICVLTSWNNSKARSYRELHHLSSECGTGVIVQMMVFGNMNHTKSGSVSYYYSTQYLIVSCIIYDLLPICFFSSFRTI